MTKYAFILGRKHLLSLAELAQITAPEQITDLCRSAAFIELPEPLASPQTVLNRLGGTIKIAEVVAELAPNQRNEIGTATAAFLVKLFKDRESKVNYGVSAYNLAERHEIFLKKILIFLKKSLRAENIKSRFINHNFQNPENAAIKGEKLLEEGAEIIIIQTARAFYICRSVALQDFENYGKRDYDRPARDPHLGMLPPKLAQIMINLTGLTWLKEQPLPNTHIYDPFCGIGTVLTEGLNMGYSVTGSDLESLCITKTQTNIQYLEKLAPFQSKQRWRLFTKDATLLTAKDLQEKIAAVVTESYLGPAVSQVPPPQNREKTFTHIRETVLQSFKALHPLLEPKTGIIISLPVYRANDRFFFIENLVDKIVRLGFEIVPLIPKEVVTRHHLQLFPRPSLIYDRPDQIVGREIWKFMKV